MDNCWELLKKNELNDNKKRERLCKLIYKDFLKIREVENAIFNTPFKIISYHLLNIIFSIKVFLY